MSVILHLIITELLLLGYCDSASIFNNEDIRGKEKSEQQNLQWMELTENSTVISELTGPIGRRRPSFAGITGGNFRPQLIPPGTPWPSKPGATSKKPDIVDRFQETTSITTSKTPSKTTSKTTSRAPSGGFIWNAKPTKSPVSRPSIKPPTTSIVENNYEPPQTSTYPLIVDRFKETTSFPFIEVTTKPTRPTPNRPFYAGLTGGNYQPQLIPPGKPWPARPEDYAAFSVTKKSPNYQIKTPHSGDVFNTSNELIQEDKSPTSVKEMEGDEHEKNPYSSDGKVFCGEKPGQTIPSKTDDNISSITTGNYYENSFKEISAHSSILSSVDEKQEAEVTTKKTKAENFDSDKLGHSKPNEESSTGIHFEDLFEEVSSNAPTRPPPNRPPSVGETGGNFKPQLIPPGKPWPSKPDNNMNSITTISTFEDNFEEISSSAPTRPPPNRPPFAGETGGNFKPQLISPGKPWPSKPKNNTNSITTISTFEDNFEEISSSAPTRPPPNRPPFAGETGGNFKPQLIPPGKPWPSKPENNMNSITTMNTFADNFEEISSSGPSRPPPNRPPFAGETGGNLIPQLIPPGKPWPSKPENNTNSITTITLEDNFEEISSSAPTRPPPNRPPFAGETGGNFKPQLIPPGKPWPSKPENNTNSVTTNSTFEDNFEEISSSAPTRPPPNRPPFAGETGGNFKPQLIPPGKPWPSKPENNMNSITTISTFEDNFEEISSSAPTRPPPNRPPFAGESGGNFKPQLIPQGKPWPSKPENNMNSITTMNTFEDNFEEISSSAPTRPPPNRPPFAGETGGTFKPQLIPPGKPWPSKPENNMNSITTISTFEDNFEEISSSAPTRPPPNRPPFAGETGGNFKPQLIPQGQPWPSKPDNNMVSFTTINTFEDNFEEISSTEPTRPPPNRPPFAGETGGNYKPQIIPTGTPWPSKPDDKPKPVSTVSAFEESLEEISSMATDK